MAKHVNGVWTDERVALLKELHPTGMAFRQIAERLGGGISRNSAIGKSRRLGLPDRNGMGGKPRPTYTPEQRRARDAERARRYRERQRESPQRAEVSLPPAPLPAEIAPPDPAKHISILPRHASQCAWVVAERGNDGLAMMCGCAVLKKKDKPYCPAHAARVYARFKREPSEQERPTRITTQFERALNR